MIFSRRNGGFTLIELLVVVAIMGILAAVVTALLSSARQKGADADIKAALFNASARAELYHNGTGTFENICDNENGIGSIVSSAAKELGSSATVEGNPQEFVYNVTGSASSLGDAVCHNDAGGWTAVVSLKNPKTPGAGWCVDATGRGNEVTNLPPGSSFCP